MPLEYTPGLNAFQVWENFIKEKEVQGHHKTPKRSAFTDQEITTMKKAAAGKLGGSKLSTITKGNAFVPMPISAPSVLSEPQVPKAVGRLKIINKPRDWK